MSERHREEPAAARPTAAAGPLPRSSVTQDYLKTIYAAGEWRDAEVSVSALASRMGVSASTASETVRRLADEGLVHHERYGAVTLTAEGRRAALHVIRRHRLMETFLVEHLGYDWHEVHDEAEVLEHAVSELLVERIDAALGYPRRDPHGDPIPSVDGEVSTPRGVMLTEVAEGAGGVVVRIADDEPQVLQHLAARGVGLDARVRVIERRAFAGTVLFEVHPPAGGRDATAASAAAVELGDPAAAAIWVELTE